ncbi:MULTISPECIES: hypothetical protein [unclassified Streptomyces]|uniref:hypothetical protein n=1 Tax=unclassified Streptomyces TaxID=2593676 RepID=UPI0036ACF371
MKLRGIAWLGLLPALVLVACSRTYSEDSIPRTLCGTPVSRKLSNGLLHPLDKVTEWTSAGFREPGASSSCVVYVGDERALHLKFASHGGPMSPMKAASPDNSVTGLQNARPLPRIPLADKAVGADDGAIATTRCKDGSGADHFTLALKVTRGEFDAERRVAIERFMRAYMPATVKTLHCQEKRPSR